METAGFFYWTGLQIWENDNKRLDNYAEETSKLVFKKKLSSVLAVEWMLPDFSNKSTMEVCRDETSNKNIIQLQKQTKN